MSEGNEKTYQAVMLDIPEEELPRVMELIQRAVDESESEEVQGFIGFTRIMVQAISGTGCVGTGGGIASLPTDFNCADGTCSAR